MTTQTAIALYILAVTAWVVLCAGLKNLRRSREARRVNLERLWEQFHPDYTLRYDSESQRVIVTDVRLLDRQPSEDAYERGRLRGRVK